MHGSSLPGFMEISPTVAAALERGDPVVALESAVISHGLPHPTGLDAAVALEREIRDHGATPATTAVIDGRILVGVAPGLLARLAKPPVMKIAERDLAVAVARRATGGTTVSATLVVASKAGISVMSTGGIGGVHRGAEQTWDVSADLPALARHSLLVICAGAKAICDIGKTLEYLDTAGVTVTAYGTDRFPNFYAVDSRFPAPQRIDTPDDAAAILLAARALGEPGAVVVANPIPAGEALSADAVTQAVNRAIAMTGHVRGADVTPALLAALAQITGGRSLRANLALLHANAALAAEVASALARRARTR